MRKLKSYEVIVKTSAEWSGTVQAKSRSDARRIAGQEFDEGSLQQCGEEVETVIAFKPRTRCGSWRTFERRFRPMMDPTGRDTGASTSYRKMSMSVASGPSSIAMDSSMSVQAIAS